MPDANAMDLTRSKLTVQQRDVTGSQVLGYVGSL